MFKRLFLKNYLIMNYYIKRTKLEYNINIKLNNFYVYTYYTYILITKVSKLYSYIIFK